MPRMEAVLKTGDLREAEAGARLLAVEHDELIAKAKNASPVKRLEAISKLGPIRIDPANLEGNTRRLVDRLRETMSARHEAFRTYSQGSRSQASIFDRSRA